MTDVSSLLPLAANGFRMPAEWEEHKATWLAWPHKEASWPGKFEPVPAIWAQMVRALADSEEVHINVVDEEMRQSALAVLKANRADASTVHLHIIPTNDAWIRDHGPIFVQREIGDPRQVAIDFGYNAWGGKYPPFDLDDVVPQHVGKLLGIPVIDGGMILEGGSIDVNGEGLLLTSEACLLNPNRNPHLSKTDIEQRLHDFLGARKVLWLGEGIDGDDTDGHIDDITRFTAVNTIVTAVENDLNDINHEPLEENLRRLKEMTNLNGRPFEVVTIPMPNPVEFDGARLPASYANFYIGNSVVLLPIYNSGKKDEIAAGVLRELFPGRKVVPIQSTDLVWGLGAFHCVTQQQPAVK